MFKSSLRVGIASAILLSACSTPQSSVERHARHATFQLAQAHFDPSTRAAISDNNRRLVVFLEQFYQAGKQDHANGITRSQAEKQVEGFRHPDFLPASEQKSAFLSQVYTSNVSDKQRNILIENGIASYWDGYEGRP